MSEYVKIPKGILAKIPSILHRGIFLTLLERADDNGQIKISIRTLAEEIGVSYQNLRTALLKLSANAVINASLTQQLTRRVTCITICNFEIYNPLQNTSQRRSQRKPNATSNALVNETKPIKFIPPTPEEVAAFIAEKGYHFNPEGFIPFYKSKNWKVGNQPMKDWHAACLTWELRWKEKHGERFYYEIQPAASTDNAATRKEGRDRLRTLAAGVVSQSTGKLLDLYNGRLENADLGGD